MKVVTAGETAVVLDPLEDGAPAAGSRFQLRVSGSESNFGIALARLGVDVTWVSRLGTGPLGDLVLDVLREQRIDTTFVTRDADAPTAITFKVRRDGATSLVYYRRGSAASRLAIADAPETVVAGADVVHLTGITMALGDTARAFVLELARRARSARATVTFDLNYRAALWSPADAAAACATALPLADWVLAGEDEARSLFGGDDRAGTIDAIRRSGARGVILRVGAEGAIVAARGGEIMHVPAPVLGAIVDDIGAGDAFDAGFVFGLLRQLPPERCAEIGNLLAAYALSGTGEWEQMPTSDELGAQLDQCAGGPPTTKRGST